MAAATTILSSSPPKRIIRLMAIGCCLAILLLRAFHSIVFAVFCGLQTSYRQRGFADDTMSMGEASDIVQPRPLLVDKNASSFCLSWEDKFDIDHWWTHSPDWDEDFFASNTTHSCFNKIRDQARLDFVRKVYAVQWHGNCSLVQQKFMINSGYGASFSRILGAFSSTMLHGKFSKPFQMTRHWDGAVWLYSTKDNSSWAYCKSHDMACYLLPLSNCQAQYRSEGPPNFREDAFKRAPGKNRPESAWLRRYMNRYRKVVRKKVIDTLHEEYPRAKLPCSVMHVRRGDAGLPRPPFRRYAAVSEYLQVGHIMPQENVVLLTDDDTTIKEVERYHPGYNWIYSNRPRNQAAQGGFDGHIPSKDPAYDFVAILCELRLASRCTKLVHGYSGFVKLIEQAMSDVGTNYTTFYVNTAISKGQAAEMGSGVQRGENMIQLIHEQMKNATSNGTELAADQNNDI